MKPHICHSENGTNFVLEEGDETGPTRKNKLDKGQVPMVSKVAMDYFFMSQDGETADRNPFRGIVDESNGNRDMRAVAMKGLGTGAEMHWLIHDMLKDLKAWGYLGKGK